MRISIRRAYPAVGSFWRAQVGPFSIALKRLFSSAKRISAFARSYTAMQAVAKDLPGDDVPVAEMALALAERLKESNLVSKDFFIALGKLNPFRSIEVQRVAQAWAIKLEAITTDTKLRGPNWTHSLKPAAVMGGLISALLIPPDKGLSLPDATELDPVDLAIVSGQTGEHWTVSVSKHRTAEAAARDIYLDSITKSDPRVRLIFQIYGWFKLCQAGKCYSSEKVETVINENQPVQIRFGLNGFEQFVNHDTHDGPNARVRRESTPSSETMRRLLRDGGLFSE